MATPTTGFVLPQFGIFARGAAARFLEFDLHQDIRPADAIPSFRRLRAPVGDALCARPRPLLAFAEVGGPDEPAA